MAQALPRVFNIEAGAPFLEILAQEVIKGFPVGSSTYQLSDWTIFLPTQRAVTVFTEILHRLSGLNSLVLPRIRPLGDLQDDDEFAESMGADDLPEAMPRLQNLLLVMRLAQEWAAANPDLEIAREIAASARQRLGLAKSLLDFVKTIELQECDTENLASLFAVELAAHRENILGLLQLVVERLPTEQKALGKMDADKRRVQTIKREARRIASQHKGPIIAAGSTGTIPATRTLLKAIASHAEGAVILPGLDQQMDEVSWASLLPGHPQAALRGLLADLGLKRNDIPTLGPDAGARNFLSSEVFRPSETASQWHEVLPKRKTDVAAALSGLTEITTLNRHEEARAIGVIFREVLASEGKTATLVTPDRDLARRVAAEMRRWNVVVGDSAGKPLLQDGLGAALDLLLQAVMDQFAPASLMAFLRHPDVTLGFDKALYATTLAQFEITLLHQQVFPHKSWAKRALAARPAEDNNHAHFAVRDLTGADWQNIEKLAIKIDELVGLQGALMERLEAMLTLAFDASVFEREANFPTLDLLDEMKSSSANHPEATDEMQALMLREQLASTKRPPAGNVHPRLAILGALEARLMNSDVLVLGGLNEGTWPGPVDTGPWLNRTMRQSLKLPQPERDLGLAAHDFEQGFAAPCVYLTWSKRLGTAPAQASRWLLRLQNVLLAAGVAPDPAEASRILKLAAQLDEPSAAQNTGPLPRPRPKPPLAARPIRFSVTEVEKLIRDPYAIYARKVLCLQPLPDFAANPDAALRGSLFHAAIAAWNKAQAPDEQTLLEEGNKILSALDPASRELHFWRPHFNRVAAFLAETEVALREGLPKIHAELSGSHDFVLDGTTYILTARADRIDVLQNGAARLIDYKTGTLPSADQVAALFSPQLTLEAAILLKGGFKSLHVKQVQQALYLRISGGKDGLAQKDAVAKGESIDALAVGHFERFQSLLLHYRNEEQAYIPRLQMEKDEVESDYNHLSRFIEWKLVEGRT